jgi:asparagine synthase (glutamine-hydrolysing)
MTHFDFKTQLPALLHVEDRMSMAHGLEARVPMLDHPLVEFAATIPADVKFTNGELKRSLLQVARGLLPQSVTERKDKMGFPTPFTEWTRGPARDFVHDVLSTRAARGRQYVDNARVLDLASREARFGRNLWGLFSLELWQQTFHDVAVPFRADATPLAVPLHRAA